MSDDLKALKQMKADLTALTNRLNNQPAFKPTPVSGVAVSPEQAQTQQIDYDQTKRALEAQERELSRSYEKLLEGALAQAEKAVKQAKLDADNNRGVSELAHRQAYLDGEYQAAKATEKALKAL